MNIRTKFQSDTSHFALSLKLSYFSFLANNGTCLTPSASLYHQVLTETFHSQSGSPIQCTRFNTSYTSSTLFHILKFYCTEFRTYLHSYGPSNSVEINKFLSAMPFTLFLKSWQNFISGSKLPST